MSVFTIMYDNLVNTSTMDITTGAENAQFPLNNILNESPSLKFRSTGNSVVIEFDFSQTREIDTAIIVGDKTTGLDLTSAYLKTSTTTDFSSSTQNDFVLDSENNIGIVYLTSVSHRYAQLTVQGNGSYCQISNLFIGKRNELSENGLSTTSFRYSYQDRSRISENKYGQKFIDVLNLQKKISGSIEYVNSSEFNVLEEIFLAVGVTQPVWVILDKDSVAMTDGFGKLSIYGYFDKYPEWNARGGILYSTSMTIEEAI